MKRRLGARPFLVEQWMRRRRRTIGRTYLVAHGHLANGRRALFLGFIRPEAR